MRLFNASFIHVLLGRSTLNSLERMANGEREKREGKEGLFFALQLKTLVGFHYRTSASGPQWVGGWGAQIIRQKEQHQLICDSDRGKG